MQTEKETKIKKKQSIQAQKKARRSEKVCALLFVWCGLVYIFFQIIVCASECAVPFIWQTEPRAL